MPQHPSARDTRSLPLLLLVLAIVIGYGLVASSSSLWDRDEPRFSRAAVEMWEGGRGGYLVPHFNNELRPDKPILIYWLMCLCISVLGVCELALRLPSIVGLTTAIRSRVVTVGSRDSASYQRRLTDEVARSGWAVKTSVFMSGL